ncbi:motility protein A [Mobilitalea sibirica]|uniref:Motility protein A n=1 Tax=Mobilitalea sibirica TaxID=1462919 RepID=A0A8J7H0L6_9FIRM|nr:motility protein A [Mobilitalea sibirica]MBH1941994.1 motility protein A [Mobilitalea sibirica]
MDKASIIGLVLCIVMVIFGIITGDKGVAALVDFVDPTSAFITLGGAFASILIMAPSLKGYVNNLKSFSLVLKEIPSNEEDTIRSIIELSNVARKEGLLALEEAANGIDDEFLKKGVLLIVDGTDPELVRSILETELNCIETRHASTVSFWDSLGAMGPAWGMIGTLIGLINMLQGLDDPTTIGPSMAVALITTLYGSVLANWICIPIATKLKANNTKEIMIKEVMVEGLLSIQAGENPRVIEEKLKSFLSPSRRAAMSEQGGEDIG